MDRFDRIYRLHGILSNHRAPVSLKQIMEQLECSKSSADRDIQTLRDHLNAPLEYNREANGYFYNQHSSSKPYELPGLWFSAEELHGLLISQHILQSISPGILSDQIESLHDRINKMLSRENSPQPVIAEKILVTTVGRRLQDDSYFKKIASGLISNKKIHIRYQARGQGKNISERTISAQKLIYYRDNWYLVAHCHLRNGLRIFSIDSIRLAKILDKTALAIPESQLQEFLNSSYGIFTGKAEQIAKLEFSKARASWVADEHWHAEQQGEWLENGNYLLSIPFNDSRELIMDILKYGAEVTVKAPEFLKQAVKEEINKMQKNYHCLMK